MDKSISITSSLLNRLYKWVLNFEEDHLKEAHQGYHAGPAYHLEKWRSKVQGGMNTYQAMLETVVNMDQEAQYLLAKWMVERYKP